MAKSFGSINSYREESIEDVADLEEGKRKNPISLWSLMRLGDN